MQKLPFIYSSERAWRLSRHFAFWSLWFIFQLLLYSFSPSPVLQNQPFLHRILITLPEAVIYMVPSIFLAYSLMYLVIPGLVLPGHYLLAAISSLFLLLLTAGLSAGLSMTAVDYLRHRNASGFSPRIAAEEHPALYIQLGIAMLAGLRGSITVGGTAAAIKLMKCVYQKQETALLLAKEKLNAELQMLKAQLHPHFLFNTLNNIYSLTQDVPGKASAMVMGLSQLLRYILYECNRPLVPLEKELKMAGDYLRLEAMRYDEKLDISLQFPNVSGYLIAPLMLLPFIENAFKHGASQMTEQPWISLGITMESGLFSMKLINGKPQEAETTTWGIGIENVRKRLALIYPEQHTLEISDLQEIYIVNLKIKLSHDRDQQKI
ncbi:sensor histidine kinase [Pedobacter miscanthi]|nr:sensor histidine kinase [Pedobacter miscanthi]